MVQVGKVAQLGLKNGINALNDYYEPAIGDIVYLQLHFAVAHLEPVRKIFPQAFALKVDLLVDLELGADAGEHAMVNGHNVAVAAATGRKIDQDEVLLAGGL